MASQQTRNVAQDALMSYLLDAVEFWQERLEQRGQGPFNGQQALEINAEVKRQANRMARLIGYEIN